jgi:UDP-3-O-[3-hydroxymyristoyl] N-acetylglucosamine deacetylase
MRLQTTLNDEITLRGVGLHTGNLAEVKLRPAQTGSGIRFVREIAGQYVIVPAHFSHVTETTLCTTLCVDAPQQGSASVKTVEHLMAALHVCGVDNIDVFLPQQEVPIMDGSSACFVDAILKVGLRHLNSVACQWVVTKTVEIRDGARYASLKPHPCFALDFTIVYEDTIIGTQKISVDEFDDLLTQVMPARTFGLLRDVEMLKAHNLARGGSLDNAVVVGDDGVLNPEGLRYEDEFVRHKILDAIGDLALAGAPIRGRYEGVRAGHELNNLLLRKAFDTPGAMQLAQYSEGASRNPVAAMPLAI